MTTTMHQRTGAGPKPSPSAPEGAEGGKGNRRRPWELQLGRWWWALPGVALVVGIIYAATIAGGVFAFTNWTGIGDFQWIGFENFVAIFKDQSKVLAVGNTLFLAFGSVVLANIMGLILALALNRTLKTRMALRVLFFMPVVLSPLAVSYVWKFIFEYDGPVNAVLTALGMPDQVRAWTADPTFAIWTILVVLVWQSTGIAMVIYLAGLAGVPHEVEEAAAIDGANLWQRFVHVVAPALRPAIAISTTLGLVNGLRVFDQIMALTGGGPASVTETLATEVYKQSFSLGQFGQGAALALVLTLIILVFAVIQQRVTRDNEK